MTVAAMTAVTCLTRGEGLTSLACGVGLASLLTCRLLTSVLAGNEALLSAVSVVILETWFGVTHHLRRASRERGHYETEICCPRIQNKQCCSEQVESVGCRIVG